MNEEAPPLNELAGLLGLPVRHHGITLGEVTDVLLGESAEPVGLAVRSVVGEPAFLPWPSVELGEDEVLVPVPLAVLTESELDYYRESSRSLVELLEGGPDAAGEPVIAEG